MTKNTAILLNTGCMLTLKHTPEEQPNCLDY